MAYTPTQIILWMQICQPLARIGEAKRKARGDTAADVDLDVKLYLARLDLQYANNQNASSDILFTMGNYGLSLCGVYLFTAQATVAGGGSITPIVPGSTPDPYDFTVSATSFIVSGATSKVISNFVGYNVLFVRGQLTQSKVDPGDGSTWYSWNKNSGLFTLNNGAAQTGENFQIYPIA